MGNILYGAPAELSPTIPSSFSDYVVSTMPSYRQTPFVNNFSTNNYTPILPANPITPSIPELPTSSQIQIVDNTTKTSSNPNKRSIGSSLKSLSNVANFFSKNPSFIGNGIGTVSNALKGVVKQADNKGDQITGTILNTAGDALMTVNPFLGGAFKGLSFLTTSVGKKVKGNTDKEFTDSSASYGGLGKLEDKKYGMFGTLFGAAGKYQDKVTKREAMRLKSEDVLRKANQNMTAYSNAAQNAINNYNIARSGGWNQFYGTTQGKKGMKLDENLNWARSVLTSKSIHSFESGGKMSVIPDGALHARKHNIEDPILNGNITKKGIPVIKKEGDSVDQIAEIEVNEIIFSLEITNKLEKLRDKGDDDAAIEAGKLLVEEILFNTKDNTGLIDKIK